MAAHKLEKLLLVNNDGWKAKLADTNQRKWYPRFWIDKDLDAPGGLRLSFYGSGFDFDSSTLGVRHACKSEELSNFMGKECADLYLELHI